MAMTSPTECGPGRQFRPPSKLNTAGICSGSSIPSLLERALALLAGRAALSANIRSKRKVAALLGGGTKA